MTEQPVDLWAERRDELVGQVAQLRPEQALEILQRVAADCTEGRMLGAYLVGTIRGMVERSTICGSSSTNRTEIS